jgi:XcyI restriction endonuclease
MNPMISVPPPDLQLHFVAQLTALRATCLQDALRNVVSRMDIGEVDMELRQYVSRKDLALLASRGLRAELAFPVPCILREAPILLGYYRMLLGMSQKGFYSTAYGLSSFKSMEENGRMNSANQSLLDELCKSLVAASSLLLAGIGKDGLTRDILDDLTLLTLGSQLRGGANVRIGTAGIETVFNIMRKIVQSHTVLDEPNRVEVLNAAGRTVLIALAADPDIVIQERMPANTVRNIVAIEVKAGKDYSNIHNRLGEAEKSHQKAKLFGYVERWTIINVSKLDPVKAAQESPTTDRFYRIADIAGISSAEFVDFKNRLISMIGLPDA